MKIKITALLDKEQRLGLAGYVEACKAVAVAWDDAAGVCTIPDERVAEIRRNFDLPTPPIAPPRIEKPREEAVIPRPVRAKIESAPSEKTLKISSKKVLKSGCGGCRKASALRKAARK